MRKIQTNPALTARGIRRELAKFIASVGVRPSWFAWVLALFLCAALSAASATVKAPNGTDTNPLNLTPEVQEGFKYFNSLEYEKSGAIFEKVLEQHPSSPMAVGYVLNNTVFQELYRLDLLDTTMYVQDRFLSQGKPEENPVVTKRVNSLYDRAIQLSDDRLKKNPKDADALFARGYATSVETLYVGMVDRSYVAALKKAMSARDDNEDVLKLDPKYMDCYLALGVHNFVIGSLSLPFRLLVGVIGLHGSKSKGIKDLRLASQKGVINSVAARTALGLFLRREGKYPEASQVVDGLHKEYPHNFLFALEAANLMKDSGVGMPAVKAYQSLIDEALKPGDYYPNAHLELAYYGLGEAARGQREFKIAADAYASAAKQPTASPLMQRRAHLKSGEMDDLLHDRAGAKEQYDEVLKQGDSDEADRARQYESKPYSGR
jgi:tetratricopeptide (TPR) repeat protein